MVFLKGLSVISTIDMVMGGGVPGQKPLQVLSMIVAVFMPSMVNHLEI
jgi:hypothetical protein